MRTFSAMRKGNSSCQARVSGNAIVKVNCFLNTHTPTRCGNSMILWSAPGFPSSDYNHFS